MLHPLETHRGETSCHAEPVQKAVDPQRLVAAPLVYLLVRGMGCPACAMRVRNALVGVDGVLAAEVFLEPSVARVLYDPAQVTAEELPRAVAASDISGRHHYTAQVIVFSSQESGGRAVTGLWIGGRTGSKEDSVSEISGAV